MKHQPRPEKWAKGQYLPGRRPADPGESDKNPRPESGEVDAAPARQFDPTKKAELAPASFLKLEITNPSVVFGAPEPPAGKLERVPVPTAYPYAVHGSVLVTFPNGTFLSGGTLIGPRHVLTAGHNIYDAAKGGFATKVLFRPPSGAGNDPDRPVAARLLLTFREWVHASDRSRDIPSPAEDMGLIVLAEDVGERAGWLGIAQFEAARELAKDRINVTGYPWSVEGKKTACKQMWTSGGVVTAVGSGILSHNARTSPGVGGAAIWGIWPGRDEPLVVGVHAAGSPTPDGIRRGSRITRSKFAKLVEWLNAH
jgi:V8-like Glu-specific endopeptidase